MRLPTVGETEAHGAEHDMPQTVPMPEQPSNAMANGAATRANRTITTRTRLIS